MAYLKQVLIAVDQLANALSGGWADETFSARMYRERRYGAVRFIDAVFFFDKNHCEESYRSELLRTQLPGAYRRGVR